ncbi:01eaa87d-0ae4-4dca-b3b7-39ce65150c1c [Thermothielavioides terrestris]|jgi:hypothetical protein|uniref:Uncharacterized protein n=2 Tax=Thermothielavioides terrestris TaxID=2587410 RepID=G2QTW2_THETT|nr:uncharacterized protein THITE_2169516 [Thermothielavioides terrestris NRRL 8126]AEO63621.1 hypothetical protein THITE_2169516 [Thermothielavioides terrestris NRRL 8126]SPQ20885.1 01eaa87d-0ae4-4dca-b3b7-39ce65150c1c [Thermothielavioides terrestris]
MAFQQPTRQLPPRVHRNEPADAESAVLSPQDRGAPTESQTWVLFTPGTDAGTTASYLSSAQDDQITPGRSRISDLGSLDTATPSEFNLQVPSEALAGSVAEEDAELDSLDSHLPEFRGVASSFNQSQVPHTAPVLPGHDGLGSFKFEVPGLSADAQERLYAFERFNPNRVGNRAESFSLGQLEPESEEAQELERTRRIEAWRLEQSQLLLEDIRKETRRRRKSEVSLRKSQQETSLAREAPERSVADEEAADITLGGTDWHDQDSPASSDPSPGFWTRIARKVICDLMGIDDKLLAVLFGEALPDDEMLQSPPKSPAAEAVPHKSGRVDESSLDSEWQLRLLNRIARELGGLVYQTCPHPGAFSTYSRVQHMPLPYAGLPVIPEATTDGSDGGERMDDSIPYMPQFKPTVGQAADVHGARSCEPPTLSAPSAPDMTRSDPHTFTQQEWEQDLDIRLVFRYLRSRFTSARPSSPPFSSGASHLAASSTQDIAAKAARVRQHHPLVSHAHAHGYHRARPVERRTFKATVPPSPVGLRHPPGSCASQSTRRSARRSSVSSRPSSRHYWDIGGSIGTGSVITSTGPMGSWGEV